MIPIMMDCTRVILDEIACKQMKRKDIAESYALAIVAGRIGGESVDWKLINDAIIDRWSPYALEWIKTKAWKSLEERFK